MFERRDAGAAWIGSKIDIAACARRVDYERVTPDYEIQLRYSIEPINLPREHGVPAIKKRVEVTRDISISARWKRWMSPLIRARGFPLPLLGERIIDLTRKHGSIGFEEKEEEEARVARLKHSLKLR